MSITLKTKSFVFTPEDEKKLSKAFADKGAADQTLKDAFAAMGVEGADYDKLWSTFDNNTITENAKNSYFDIYYNADGAPVGFATKADENKVENFFVIAADDKNIIIDSNLGSQVTENSVTGHLTYDNETLDGKIVFKTKSQNYEQTSTVQYNNITVANGKTVGDAVFTQTSNGQEQFKFVYSFDTNENGGTVEMKATMNGEDMGSVKTEIQQTDASDIAIPTGTTYKFTDQESMQKFSESCNIEGWQENVKKTVGDELYDELFGSKEAPVYPGPEAEKSTAEDITSATA